MEKAQLIAIRPTTPADRNFILATWLRGLYYGQSWFSEIPKDIFMTQYHKVLEHLLAKSVINVACLQDDPEVILGYIVLSQDHKIAHWLFVKSAWRSIGIAKRLVPADITKVTHLTKVGLSILKKHPGVIFDPFSI